jgi:general nucleoside transport system ATP-binding protein
MAAVELSGICKSFGGFLALDHATFSAQRGEVHALLGENGAGKSSLMNVLAGFYAPDAGSIIINGNTCRLAGPRDAAALGIGMIHQHFKLVKAFTVAENILLANPRNGYREAQAAIRREIRAKSEALSFVIDPDRRVDTLSVAEQQRVEILKALVGGADILILDEPTAVLTEQESESLLSNIRDLAVAGAAVILVTHKLQDVKAFSHRVTVMRGGRTVNTLDPLKTSTEQLTTLTVGENVEIPSRIFHERGGPRLIVSHLKHRANAARVTLDDVTFTVHAGEIYGIAGVGGNGQTELLEALCGGLVVEHGRIEITGDVADKPSDITKASPRQRLAAGFASIPADRHAHALASSLSIADNFAIGHIHEGRFGSWARVDRHAIWRATNAAIHNADVRGVRSLSQRASLLSGGNAQKLVLAREFSRFPRILVTHSPTRGLDAKATAAVQRWLIEARNEGVAVVLVSEDLDEVLGTADRIGVLVRGRIVAEFAAPADRQAVGKAMVNHV